MLSVIPLCFQPPQLDIGRLLKFFLLRYISIFPLIRSATIMKSTSLSGSYFYSNMSGVLIRLPLLLLLCVHRLYHSHFCFSVLPHLVAANARSPSVVSNTLTSASPSSPISWLQMHVLPAWCQTLSLLLLRPPPSRGCKCTFSQRRVKHSHFCFSVLPHLVAANARSPSMVSNTLTSASPSSPISWLQMHVLPASCQTLSLLLLRPPPSRGCKCTLSQRRVKCLFHPNARYFLIHFSQ